MSIHVGTFNILDPLEIQTVKPIGFDKKNTCNWSDRKVKIIDLIENSNLDVIGLQGLSKASMDDLVLGINKCGYEIKRVDPKNKLSGVLAVLYKKDNMKLINASLPTVVKGAPHPHFYLDLYNETTKKTIRVGNCHLSHVTKSQQQQIEALHGEMLAPSKNGASIDVKIMMGNFRADALTYFSDDNNCFSKLKNSDYQFDGELYPTELSPKCPGLRVDWIFVKPSVNNPIQLVANQALYQSQQNIADHLRLSDHFMIATEIQFTNLASNDPSPPPPPPPPPLLFNPFPAPKPVSSGNNPSLLSSLTIKNNKNSPDPLKTSQSNNSSTIKAVSAPDNKTQPNPLQPSDKLESPIEPTIQLPNNDSLVAGAPKAIVSSSPKGTSSAVTKDQQKKVAFSKKFFSIFKKMGHFIFGIFKSIRKFIFGF